MLPARRHHDNWLASKRDGRARPVSRQTKGGARSPRAQEGAARGPVLFLCAGLHVVCTYLGTYLCTEYGVPVCGLYVPMYVCTEYGVPLGHLAAADISDRRPACLCLTFSGLLQELKLWARGTACRPGG